ncbi:DUF4229 domain-containing protein [Sporosarcina sp. resist]|uniref:DUF4229 domain-containing protein n=1 Tax=Sporosarcina sp. resist TaxID=2762563 RepID=UPI00164D81CE|nr:DUF4229 domain-containing protein [Sporosarcina sp. resist]QNK86848.1 DUF4229 domain-containing protein [Sporosarcina sp. resist]
MGDYALERFLLGVILFVLFLIAIFLRKRGRIVISILFIAILIGYWVFYGIREQVLQNRYEESIEIVDTYLQDKYPNETWTIDTIVEEGRKIRPTKVKVIFDNEQSVDYIYKVYEKNRVILYEYGYPENMDTTNFMHDETHNN